MTKLDNKLVIRHSGRNKFKVKTFSGDSTEVIAEEVIEYPAETLDQVAEELGVKEVELVTDPNTGEEFIEIPAGTEVSEEVVGNCGTAKRNSKKFGKIIIKRHSNSKFVVTHSDGEEEIVIDPTLAELETLDEVAEQLPVTNADIVETDDGEFIEIDETNLILDDEDDLDDEDPIVQNSGKYRRHSINPRSNRYRRNSAPQRAQRPQREKRRTIRNW